MLTGAVFEQPLYFLAESLAAAKEELRAFTRRLPSRGFEPRCVHRTPARHTKHKMKTTPGPGLIRSNALKHLSLPTTASTRRLGVSCVTASCGADRLTQDFRARSARAGYSASPRWPRD